MLIASEERILVGSGVDISGVGDRMSEPSAAKSLEAGQQRRTPETGSGARRWWFALGLIAACLLGVFFWYQAGAAAERDRLQLIERLIRSRQYAEAVEQADRWVATAPKSAQAHFQRARALIGLNRPQDALEAADQAQGRGFDLVRLRRILGLSYVLGGRTEEAEPILAEAEAQDAQPDCLVEQALAQIYYGASRLGAAVQAIERWSRGAPEDPRPAVLRAEIDRQLRVEPVAVAVYYREALERDPQYGPAILGLAEMLREQGQFDVSLEQYRRYLEQNPNSAAALAGAGLCALGSGTEDEARSWFDRALRIDPDQVDALEGNVALALRHGEAEAALTVLDRLVKLDPGNPEHHYRRGVALERLKRPDEARDERETTERLRREIAELGNLRRALIKSPRDPERQAELSAWLLEHGYGEEGVTLAKQLLRRPGGHPQTALRVAQYYEKQGNTGLANYYRSQARAKSGVETLPP